MSGYASLVNPEDDPSGSEDERTGLVRGEPPSSSSASSMQQKTNSNSRSARSQTQKVAFVGYGPIVEGDAHGSAGSSTDTAEANAVTTSSSVIASQLPDEDHNGNSSSRHGCWYGVRRTWHVVWRTTTACLPGWHSAVERRSQSGGGRHIAGRSTSSTGTAATTECPGEGYESVGTTRQSMGPQDVSTQLFHSPRPTDSLPHDSSTGTGEGARNSGNVLCEEGAAATQQAQQQQQQQTQHHRRTIGQGPLIASAAQRKALLAGDGRTRGDSRDGHSSSSTSSALGAAAIDLKERLEPFLQRSPVNITVDFVGRSVSLTISGPIQLVKPSASTPGYHEGEEEGGSPTAEDQLPLESIEDVLMEQCCTAIGSTANTSGVSAVGSDCTAGPLQLHSVRLVDVDFTPAPGSNFSRHSASAANTHHQQDQPNQHSDENSLEDPEEAEFQLTLLKQRVENIRLKTIALFNNLVYESKTVCSVSLIRCSMTAADLQSKLKLPEDGRLEQLVMKECGLSDPHLSTLVRCGQRSLSNAVRLARERQSLAAGGTGSTFSETLLENEDDWIAKVHFRSFFGGMIRLELRGSFSQASMAVLLRFLRDDQLVECTYRAGSASAEGSDSGRSSMTGSPSRTPTRGASFQLDAGRGSSASNSNREGATLFKGMKLQQLQIPQQLASFVRCSEFARRLPSVVINGRMVGLPSTSIFGGSSTDLSSSPPQSTDRR